MIQGEDGTGGIGLGAGGFEFVDPNEDPELALALRVSMEEQRQRQEDEARRAGAPIATEALAAGSTATGAASNEDAMLERALAMSMDSAPIASAVTAPSVPSAMASFPDFSTMTEEEQIAYAMQMSMQEARESILIYVSFDFQSV